MKSYSSKPAQTSAVNVQNNSLANAWLTSATSFSSHHLPTSATELIGREQDLQVIGELLRQRKLVTLTGPGGVGKTRLAQQLAWNNLSYYRDGVFWISLAGLHDPEYVIPALNNALGITFTGDSDPRTYLFNCLSDRQILLVIDNFEYVLAAASLLADIVTRTTAVTLLVTSRERLNLYEEWVYEVAGLSVPREGIGSAAVLQEQGASALFLQRAEQLGVHLPDNDATHAAITRLCRLVNGLPLALELAAVWVRAMSIQELVQAMEQNLDFLDQAWSNLAPHQRSLRMVFEHSWQRLNAEQQRVCSGLALFQGRIQRPSASQVVEATAATLASLIDKSFLRWEISRECYVLHPVLRQYAAEKITEQPAAAEHIRNRHCAYFTQFLHVRENALQKYGQAQVLNEITSEIDNIRQAWDWAAQHGLGHSLEKGLDSLFRYYTYRGQFHEGQAAFTRAADYWQNATNHCQESLPEMAWKLHARRAIFKLKLAPCSEAREILQACVSAFRTFNDLEELSLCLSNLGYAFDLSGEQATAQALLEESLAVAQSAQLAELEADSWKYLGIAYANRSAFDQAEPCYEKALRLYRRIGHLQGEGEVLNTLAIVFMNRNDHGQARVRCEQAVEIHRALGNQYGEGKARINLGVTCQYQGFYQEAATHYQKALELSRAAGYRNIEGVALINLGQIYQLLGDFRPAQEFSLQALALFEALADSPSMNYALYNLGGIAYDTHDAVTALAHGQRIVTIAQEHNDHFGWFYGLRIIGRAQTRLKHPQEALAAFQQALEIGRELRQTSQVLALLAEKAEVYYTQGNLTAARAQVEEILKYQDANLLEEREDDPCQIYLTCYQILKAAQDSRAATLLQTAHRLLLDRAAQLSDESQRRLFLENIDAHREILAEMSAVNTPTQAASHSPAVSALIEPLTPRELEVLRLMAEGLSNDEIAQRLVLGRATIKTHAHRVFTKLGVRNRAQAIKRGHDLQLL